MVPHNHFGHSWNHDAGNALCGRGCCDSLSEDVRPPYERTFLTSKTFLLSESLITRGSYSASAQNTNNTTLILKCVRRPFRCLNRRWDQVTRWNESLMTSMMLLSYHSFPFIFCLLWYLSIIPYHIPGENSRKAWNLNTSCIQPGSVHLHEKNVRENYKVPLRQSIKKLQHNDAIQKQRAVAMKLSGCTLIRFQRRRKKYYFFFPF